MGVKGHQVLRVEPSERHKPLVLKHLIIHYLRHRRRLHVRVRAHNPAGRRSRQLLSAPPRHSSRASAKAAAGLRAADLDGKVEVVDNLHEAANRFAANAVDERLLECHPARELEAHHCRRCVCVTAAHHCLGLQRNKDIWSVTRSHSCQWEDDGQNTCGGLYMLALSCWLHQMQELSMCRCCRDINAYIQGAEPNNMQNKSVCNLVLTLLRP